MMCVLYLYSEALKYVAHVHGFQDDSKCRQFAACIASSRIKVPFSLFLHMWRSVFWAELWYASPIALLSLAIVTNPCASAV